MLLQLSMISNNGGRTINTQFCSLFFPMISIYPWTFECRTKGQSKSQHFIDSKYRENRIERILSVDVCLVAAQYSMRCSCVDVPLFHKQTLTYTGFHFEITRFIARFPKSCRSTDGERNGKKYEERKNRWTASHFFVVRCCLYWCNLPPSLSKLSPLRKILAFSLKTSDCKSEYTNSPPSENSMILLLVPFDAKGYW